MSVRNDDPDTSHTASQTANLSELQATVLRLITAGAEHGATGSEMAESGGQPRDSYSPRCPALVKLGLIHDSGLRRTGPTGKSQIVWTLTSYPVTAAPPEKEKRVMKAEASKPSLAKLLFDELCSGKLTSWDRDTTTLTVCVEGKFDCNELAAKLQAAL